MPLAGFCCLVHLSLESGSAEKPLPRPCRWFTHCALVLCPNAELCDQVVGVADRLRTPSGDPLVRTAAVSARSPPSGAPIDIVVSTPAALTRLLTDYGSAYGRGWAAEALAERVRHLVADEADALVSSDSYWQPLCRILDVRHCLLCSAVAVCSQSRCKSDMRTFYCLLRFAFRF